ncbi:glycosyltransferase family A protein [Oscillatoria sp. HE19RPO]|uniref:glycosyltransferase family 2 protein n=1 Tax=Oscillatoria sp. HE19RPO TaxID=2954806 RepID=UPI0020C554F6|nr:glycosyltransferase family A protein [Oscillatoria sp. HE19RPO]
MSEAQPLVSAIVPVYNCDRYLKEAIESILRQTHPPFEILAIDDGSTDNSAAVAREFSSSVQYYSQPHQGAGTARNYGTQLAKGNYLAFLDADDIWEENKLNRQLEIFANQPEVDIIFGQMKNFHSPELPEEVKQQIYCPPEIIPGYCPGTMMIKKEAFERVGLFENQWKLGEFIDWYLKAMEAGLKSVMLPDLVLRRRIHQTNTGIRDRDFRKDYVRIVKASLDRRRGKTPT